MAKIDDYRPRLSTELRPDQYIRLQRILPHGMQKPLIQCLVDGIIALYDKGGLPALTVILSNHITIEQLAIMAKPYTMKILKVEDQDGND